MNRWLQFFHAPATGALILLAATFAAYAPALRGGFIWDDDAHVSENANLRTAEGLRRIWFEPHTIPQYYPLVHTTFWLEYHLWGLSTLGYHSINVLLHVATAVLIGILAARLGLPGAALAAAVFALHPVQVESVAWITERKNVLSGFFYLAALLCYLRFRPFATTRREQGSGARYYALACLLFVCALLSKTVACTLPAAILVLVWWKNGRIRWSDCVPLLPMFAAGIVSGLTTAFLERRHVGAEGAEWTLGLLDRCLIAGRAIWFYLAKLLWPEPLSFVYPRWQIDAHALWQYLFPLAAVAALTLMWSFRFRIGRAPLASALFFGGTLFPALGFFNLYPMLFSFVADHFQYLAAIGPIILASAWWAGFVGCRGPLVRRAGWAGAAIVVCVLGLLSWRRAHVYSDSMHLWSDTLKKNPEAWMAHLNLGIVYASEGMLDEAITSYQEALRLHPNEANIYYDMGSALARQGRLEAALPFYDDAIRLRPYFVEAHYNRGLTLCQLGRFAEAVFPLRQALRFDPGSATTHHQLAQALEKSGDSRGALGEYRSTLGISPDYAPALNDLAWMLATHPDPEMRDGKEAIRLAERAQAGSAAPDPNYLDTLAAAYAESGRFDDAVRTAQQAASLARSRGIEQQAAEMETRLNEYLFRRPYRNSGPPPSH